MQGLSIFTCATQSFCYALEQCARHIARSFLCAGSRFQAATWILVGDEKSDFGKAVEIWSQTGQDHQVIRIKVDETGELYKKKRQQSIATLQQVGLDACRKTRNDYCLSVESDTLIPSNGIRCMYDSLIFDDGYYSIATCPYPSQGGGAFLGGRGTPYNQIAEDYDLSERQLPEKLAKEIKRAKEELALFEKKRQRPPEDRIEDFQKLMEEAKKYPPKDNIWNLNGKKWKKRGWLDNAYPACSKGMILPSDWCGMGCTMMNWEALCAADFTGYDGGGTQDLHLVWNCWYPKSLRINVIPHCLAHHVVRDPEGREGKKLLFSHHAHPEDGDFAGHLRFIPKEWISY